MTSDCPNSRDAPPKCALCSGDHPSNYKGCSIYRDLQRRKKPKPKNQVFNNINPKNSLQETQPVKASSVQPPAANYTYAQATSNSNSNNTNPPPPDISTLLASFMNEFKQLLNPLIALLTKVVSNLLDKK